MTTDEVAGALEGLRAGAPLVHCLTNVVVAGFTANALLAAGASPAMADAVEDAEVLARAAGGVLVNLGTATHASAAGMRAAVDLCRLGARRVLVKGGHRTSAGESADVYVDREVTTWFRAPRVDTKHSHGTGCTLSSAIAALRPRRPDWISAVGDAKAYVTEALAAADRLSVGTGCGPVHHSHAWWGPR
ncbi:bifunctional hydroxymethylpyrimidine kinase/phosphomethylpyrimidine kinase [Actinopolymorpha alba]|uniref:bifunctional hydroxymethylpyrimidine kinase/phosphomethylpyrimidine kinase n=1 Tax=Actinopolymorpha alba TaxID=533267 RepID=UPI000369A1F4|nr:bifunctional hydroxymethylpyrimidine kinase/phosphomethylpyrimidine kinase [Actinopolymorpha alba]